MCSCLCTGSLPASQPPLPHANTAPSECCVWSRDVWNTQNTRGRETSKLSSVLVVKKEPSSFVKKGQKVRFLTDLVSSKSMTGVHNQLFSTLIVLSSIQTWIFAQIFHLKKKRRQSKSCERKQNEKLTSSTSCSNNFSVWSVSVVLNWSCFLASGDPKWKPTVARQTCGVLKAESWWWVVRSYWAKA